ncbi:hypothetical protein D5085_10775 [Ectothiorhodospiraceae bacterium BW-2]|nr:hypothetical protein D5085_10775 [Ectothiorhodospiraceae bacterium BW-2]
MNDAPVGRQRAVVRLFGSRLDDSKRGGDIDLLIETDISQPDELVKAKNRFLAQLYRELGEQKIDRQSIRLRTKKGLHCSERA